MSAAGLLRIGARSRASSNIHVNGAPRGAAGAHASQRFACGDPRPPAPAPRPPNGLKAQQRDAHGSTDKSFASSDNYFTAGPRSPVTTTLQRGRGVEHGAQELRVQRAERRSRARARGAEQAPPPRGARARRSARVPWRTLRRPAPRLPCPVSTGGGTRRARSVRGGGRGVSVQYGGGGRGVSVQYGGGGTRHVRSVRGGGGAAHRLPGASGAAHHSRHSTRARQRRRRPRRAPRHRATPPARAPRRHGPRWGRAAPRRGRRRRGRTSSAPRRRARASSAGGRHSARPTP